MNACVLPIIGDLEAIFFFIAFLVLSKVCPCKLGNLGTLVGIYMQLHLIWILNNSGYIVKWKHIRKWDPQD